MSKGETVFRTFCRMASPAQLCRIIAKEEEEARAGLVDRARYAEIAREVAAERNIDCDKA